MSRFLSPALSAVTPYTPGEQPQDQQCRHAGQAQYPGTEGRKAVQRQTDPGHRLQQTQQCQYPKAAYRAAQQTAQPAVLAGCAAHHTQQADGCRSIGPVSRHESSLSARSRRSSARQRHISAACW